MTASPDVAPCCGVPVTQRDAPAWRHRLFNALHSHTSHDISASAALLLVLVSLASTLVTLFTCRAGVHDAAAARSAENALVGWAFCASCSSEMSVVTLALMRMGGTRMVARRSWVHIQTYLRMTKSVRLRKWPSS